MGKITKQYSVAVELTIKQEDERFADQILKAGLEQVTANISIVNVEEIGFEDMQGEM